MLPARGVAGFLHIQAEIDLVGQHLDVTLRLHPAAHDTERFPRLAAFHHEPGNDGVKRTFARRVNVRVARLHREKFAAILKHEAEPGNNNTAAHPAIIALDETDHVPFVISGAEVNRVAAVNLTGGNSLRGVIWIDQLPSLSCVFLRKEFG